MALFIYQIQRALCFRLKRGSITHDTKNQCQYICSKMFWKSHGISLCFTTYGKVYKKQSCIFSQLKKMFFLFHYFVFVLFITIQPQIQEVTNETREVSKQLNQVANEAEGLHRDAAEIKNAIRSKKNIILNFGFQLRSQRRG